MLSVLKQANLRIKILDAKRGGGGAGGELLGNAWCGTGTVVESCGCGCLILDSLAPGVKYHLAAIHNLLSAPQLPHAAHHPYPAPCLALSAIFM